MPTVLVAAGGGSAIGLAKIIARDTGLPIIAVPTTYSGSEATPIWGTSEGERKTTGRDPKVMPRTIIYDPELTLALAGRRHGGERHERDRALRRGAVGRRAHAGHGGLRHRGDAPVRRPPAARGRRRRATATARGECLIAAWLAGDRAGRRHRPAPQARPCARRLRPAARRDACDHPAACDAFQSRRGAGGARPARRRARQRRSGRRAWPTWCGQFPIPQRLRDVGFDAAKIDDAAAQVAALGHQGAEAGVGGRRVCDFASRALASAKRSVPAILRNRTTQQQES